MCVKLDACLSGLFFKINKTSFTESLGDFQVMVPAAGLGEGESTLASPLRTVVGYTDASPIGF